MHKILQKLCLLSLLTITQTQAMAMINCDKAGLPVEKMICSDERLLFLDRSLNKIYSELLSKIASEKQVKFLQSQQDWIVLRNQCLEYSCIANEYQKRTNELIEKLYPSVVNGEMNIFELNNSIGDYKLNVSDSEWNVRKLLTQEQLDFIKNEFSLDNRRNIFPVWVSRYDDKDVIYLIVNEFNNGFLSHKLIEFIDGKINVIFAIKSHGLNVDNERKSEYIDIVKNYYNDLFEIKDIKFNESNGYLFVRYDQDEKKIDQA